MYEGLEASNAASWSCVEIDVITYVSKFKADEEAAPPNILELRSIINVITRWKKITILSDLKDPSTRFSLKVYYF